MEHRFQEITWDDEDLIGCKQAVGILLGIGVTPEELLYADCFGNLDVAEVLEEYGAFDEIEVPF